MKLTVFGATGGVGGHLVRQALDAGHEVAAVVRDPARFTISHPALRVHTATTLSDPAQLLAALEASDAALSGIGSRTRKAGTITSTATRGILGALEQAGVRRFLAVSASPVGPSPDGDGFVNRRILLPIISAIFADVYRDLATMEHDLAGTSLDWTSLRPPKLTNRPLTGRYRTAIGSNVPRGASISRADLAHAMLAAVGNPATFRQPLGIAY